MSASASKLQQSAIVACLILLFSGCSRAVATYEAGVLCEAGAFSIADNFEGARRGTCEVFSDGHVRLNIHPEDTGTINNSPWYAFRLIPNGADVAEIELRYHGGDHRYWPKFSTDGSTWQRLQPSSLRQHWFKSSVSLRVELQAEPVYVAAQELVMPSDMELWSQKLSEQHELFVSTLGKSGNGEAIVRMDINPDASEVVFLAGRQHPPELTGAIAFFAFYESILADSPVANAFRSRFQIVALPMLNPDGVKAGHWRHNLGSVDLNRDWGPFSQPETRLAEELLNELDASGKRVVAAVDFHSTARNLMYTQEEKDVTVPAAFSKRWIDAAMERLPGYAFSHEPRPTSDLATSRNFFYKRYGIPAVTYEVGDEEERQTIRHAAQVFAEEFMRLLNETAEAKAATQQVRLHG